MEARSEQTAGKPESPFHQAEDGSIYVAQSQWAIGPNGEKLYFSDRFKTKMDCPHCGASDVVIKVSLFRDTDVFCLETINCCKRYAWAKKRK